MQNNQLVVVVPVFRDHFSDSEILSLRQLYKHKNKYKIISITPNDLPQKSDFDQNIQFNNRYFVGTSSYSKLLLSKEFYTHFLDYEYILIYQLDCIILSDDLKSWCELGYDYIGAPLFWNKNKPENGFSRVGNGGLSFRKKSKMIEHIKTHVYNGEPEDIYFSKSKILQFPSIKEASNFSTEYLVNPNSYGIHRSHKILSNDKIKLLRKTCPEFNIFFEN